MDYKLDELGFYQFERLCQALLRARLGPVLETWGGSRDLGRDAYTAEQLNFPNPDEAAHGPFVFQVKFVSGANAAGSNPRPVLKSAVAAECERIEDRIEAGLWMQPTHYSLLTNVQLTPTIREEVTELLQAALPRTTVLLHGATEFSADLDAHPAVRQAFPQLLGIRDLEHLIRAASSQDILSLSTLSMAAARRYAQVFVPTPSYFAALRTLEKHGFAVLTGPPEMGKTITASIIALLRLTLGWEAYECREPDDLFKVLNPEAKQVFVVDDAFGSTEYRPDLALDWAAVLHRVVDACDKSHHLLWTSRPAPLREGLHRVHLQDSARGFPDFREVQVNTARLSLPQRAQILYRHARAAGLDPDALAIVRSSARMIVMNPQFTPLRVARFVRDELPTVVKADPAEREAAIQSAVRRGIAAPTTELSTSFATLDAEVRAVLTCMLDFSEVSVSVDRLAKRAEAYYGSPLSRSIDEIVELVEGHFIAAKDPDD
jgi:hypothetical protein